MMAMSGTGLAFNDKEVIFPDQLHSEASNRVPDSSKPQEVTIVVECDPNEVAKGDGRDGEPRFTLFDLPSAKSTEDEQVVSDDDRQHVPPLEKASPDQPKLPTVASEPAFGAVKSEHHDRHRGSIASQKDMLIGAAVTVIRQPITPSNSLGPTESPPRWKRTKKSAETGPVHSKLSVESKDSGNMRSKSTQPRAQPRNYAGTSAEYAAKGIQNLSINGRPSLPNTPKINKKYANVRSRIDANNDYVPSGGNVRIFHQPLKMSNVSSRVGSLDNATHQPGGGRVRIESRKINFKENAKPRIDAKAELPTDRPVKKILTQKLQWKAESKVGSLENANHKPAGGDVKIFDKPLKFDSVQGKVGSLENADHKPGGGNVKITEYKVQVRSGKTTTTGSRASLASSPTSTTRRGSSLTRYPLN